MNRTKWPPQYLWLQEFTLRKPDAVEDYKDSWDAIRYFVHGKMFALLVRNRGATLLNLKCDPYLSLDFRERCPTVLPGWHMNKLHWVSLSLMKYTPESVCKELVDISYELVWKGLPKRIRESVTRSTLNSAYFKLRRSGDPAGYADAVSTQKNNPAPL